MAKFRSTVNYKAYIFELNLLNSMDFFLHPCVWTSCFMVLSVFRCASQNILILFQLKQNDFFCCRPPLSYFYHLSWANMERWVWCEKRADEADESSSVHPSITYVFIHFFGGPFAKSWCAVFSSLLMVFFTFLYNNFAWFFSLLCFKYVEL